MFATHKLMGAGGVGGADLEFISSDWTTSSTTATLAAAPEAGDIILFFASSDIASALTFPSGLTQIYNVSIVWAGSPYFFRTINATAYKIATGSEGTSISGFTFSPTGAYGVGVCKIATIVYRPKASFGTVNLVSQGFFHSTSSGSGRTTTVTSGLRTEPVIAMTAVAARSPGYLSVSSPSTGVEAMPPLNFYSNSYLSLATVGFNAGDAVDMISSVGPWTDGMTIWHGYLYLT